jgi:hypothetical protein
MTVEDELLAARLEKNRHAALEGCAERLRALGSSATLMDAEHLFDGQTLVFYFLGDQPPELAESLEVLADAYDSQARLSGFADALIKGCGPGCGTDAATGSGCAGCATSCAVSGACGTKRLSHERLS